MSYTTIHDTDRDGDIVGDFGVAAQKWPQLPAILHNGAATTYRELEEQVGLLAAAYRARRHGADGWLPLVGALVSPTPAVVKHLLGILQAGAIYCPIDVALPEARQEALAEALGLERLFAVAPNLRAPANLRIETVDWDHEAETDLPQRACHRDDPAYVLCTSGSTGIPKPVVVSRHALTVVVRALRDLFALHPGDRVLQFASLSWDTCFEEILPALIAGATVVFDDAARSGSMPRFVRMLAQRAVTVLDLPTAFWHELVLYLHEENEALPGCVRLVVIGGERVDPTRLRQWGKLEVGHVHLLNTYGCTETTMVTHAVRLSGPGTEPEVAENEAEAPLGRPLLHVREHVTDEGELLVSGPALATEYLGLPDFSALGFPVADHGTGPKRWFRTGDLVARGENGLLYSRGRADEQVKVLGVRVHPAEVEAHLNSHPAVAGAVVVGERLLGRTSLTAYVAQARETSAAELKSHLRGRLPSQFVPSRVKFVAALTYTPSGKVDRTATRSAASEYEKGGKDR
jgi:amino acid adenylation domain-containing protein